MIPGLLTAALISFTVAQAPPAAAPATSPGTTPATAPSGGTAPGMAGEPSPEVGVLESGTTSKFADPVETGVPFQPSTVPPSAGPVGTRLDYGVMAQVRAWTTGDTGTGPGWSTEFEVTPGISLETTLSTFKLGAGYGARLTIPIQSTGPSFAALQRLYCHVDWTPSARWTLGFNGGVTYGENSQLAPAVTPGAPGVPPSNLNPVRSFSTYPYISADATLSARTDLSRLVRLRLSLGYFDVGGLGETGQAAQPRTWGPTAEVALDWDFTLHDTLVSSLGFVDSNLVDSPAIMILTWRESWSRRWSPDLESVVSAGAALTSSDSDKFVGVGHLMPVASVGLRYFTDVRHAFRFWFDAALAPYVDTYFDHAYQRLTGTLGIDWYAATGWFLGAFVSTALVPQAATSPQAYGTAGLSASWAPWTWFTISAGGFTQAQLGQQGADPVPAFRQWTTYLSATFRERTAF